MRRRVLPRVMALVAIALVAAAAVLFGYRTWTLRVERQAARERQAAEIERHREAQRATPSAPEAPFPAASSPTATSALLVPGPPLAGDTTSRLPPYWTAFRGPRRDGHYRERAILTNWPSSGLQPIWKQPIGGGHASFVVADGRAFTIEQRGDREVVAAYDVATGRERWTHAWPAVFSDYYGGDGPRATPVWHDGMLFVLGATGELRALDAVSGTSRWRTNILDDAGAANLEWGMAGSPLIVGDTVVVAPGGQDGRAVAAYDRTSGRRVWSALDDRAGYSSPALATLAGVEQIVLLTGTRLLGLSLDGTQLLWQFPWPTQDGINVAQPLVVDGDRIFISSGYGMGAAMVRVTRDRDRFAVEEQWRSIRMKNQFTSSVYYDGFLYGLDDSILACLDATTGALNWKGGRYGHGQVLLASGHLIVLTEEGELALVRATPERHVEVARSRALDGRTWNHPAMASGHLLVRNAAEMAAFDLRAAR